MSAANDEMMIDVTVKSIIFEQQKNGGRAPHQLIPRLVAGLAMQGIHVTRDILNGRLRKYKAEARKQGPSPSIAETTEPTNIGHQTTNEDLLDRTTMNTTQAENHESSTLTGPSRSRGRPKGTTNKAKAMLISKRKKLMNEVSVAYATRIRKKTDVKKRLPKGLLKTMVEEKKIELGIGKDVKINLATIKRRVNTQSLVSFHPGTPSPIKDIESLVLPTVIQMARVRQPMKPHEVIEFVNSMIDGTIYQKKLIAWKKIHEPHQNGEQLGKVGPGYFNRFMQRYKGILDSKIGRRFSVKRSEWLIVVYLEKMYDAIYNIFVEARVARQVVTPVAYDFHGSVVDVGSEFQYGLPSNIIIDHQDYILFGDETGINTNCSMHALVTSLDGGGGHGSVPPVPIDVQNQMNDGQVGGTKYVVPHGSVLLIQGRCTCDHRATILPLTAATGEPVVCVVIVASEREDIESSWHTGIDITVDPILDDKGMLDINAPGNLGPGKYFPSGPVCKFREKDIRTLTFTSPNASITGGILVKIFSALDDLKVFPREDPNNVLPEPCVVVDGHQSRLDPSFLKYINTKGHKWNFVLGVPYLTHIWQVGDSPEQNGCFKTQFYKAKETLMSFKLRRGMPATLTSTDIIPLLNVAWSKSFARIECNRKAVAERGWCPPTKKILQDPRVKDLQDENENENENVAKTSTSIGTTIENVSITDGKAASVNDTLVSHALRKDAITRRHENLAEGERCQQIFLDAKKMTSGVMIKAGCYSLNEDTFLRAIAQKHDKKENEQREKELKRNAEPIPSSAKSKLFAQRREQIPRTGQQRTVACFCNIKSRMGTHKCHSP